MAHTVTKRVHEVIDLVSKAKTKDEKINILKQNESQALKDVLVGAYHSNIEWNLPPGRPPFEAAEVGKLSMASSSPSIEPFCFGNGWKRER